MPQYVKMPNGTRINPETVCAIRKRRYDLSQEIIVHTLGGEIYAGTYNFNIDVKNRYEARGEDWKSGPEYLDFLAKAEASLDRVTKMLSTPDSSPYRR